MLFQKFVVNYLPVSIQNILITIVNCKAYRVRRSGKYWECRNNLTVVKQMTSIERKKYIDEKRTKFLDYSIKNSKWYEGCAGLSLSEFPVLEKNHIIDSLDEFLTTKKSECIKSSTGGTTGASMTVYYTKNCMQERMAYLDDFRSSFGYELGERVAWFSGKDILGERVVSGQYTRYDFINKIRFYSTFHIGKDSFEKYWDSFSEFKPKYIVGFPSSVFELCQIAKSRGLVLEHPVVAFFPTAETVLDVHRNVISEVLGCEIYDQYASSEGAPFIFECKEHKYHIDETTGVFEIFNKGEVANISEAVEGELLVTSFTTYGVPLIRYRIGDRITLAASEVSCKCGNIGRIVERIDGRETDYLLTNEKGRVNLGNLSNATKGVNGIVCFQAIQKNLEKINFDVVVNDLFSKEDKERFIEALRARLGNVIVIDIRIVEHIAKEKSGKFRIVKNFVE